MPSEDGCAGAAAQRDPRHPAASRFKRVWLRALCATIPLLVSGLDARRAEAGRGWIEDPTGRAVLQVSFREPPTYQDLAETQAALTRMAAILCDATDGQVRITQIRLVSSPASEDLAALWLHDADAASGGPYDAGGGDLHRLGAHLDVFASARLRPDRLAHLLGHHMFGLGDQYDDQRRRGSSCGVGPGFEAGHLDERNHSIMQGAGGMRCVEGPLLGQDCLHDDECSGSPCRAVLASEWSTPVNHDLLRGDGVACPRPSPVSRIRLSGILPSKAEPLRAFDPSDFLSARATSVWHKEVEALGPAGTLPGVKLQLYLSHTTRLVWSLSIGADAGEFGGATGQFQLLRSWTLVFNDDYSLASASPETLNLQLPASGGRGPGEIAIDIGTRNPEAQRHQGQGYDGLAMVAAGTVSAELVMDGVVGCSAEWCSSSWNEATGRWELSEQSILHQGASDWQTLTTNLPFLAAPSAAVVEDAPIVCQTPVQFFTDVMGGDQVVFVLDSSRSMGTRVDGKNGEVCANGAADDTDGETDEADCADSRLEYERIAVRAYLALEDDRKLQVGLVSMHTDAEITSEVQEASGPRRAVLGAVLGSMGAEGDTALGTALERSQEALQKVERVGRSRAVILMSDGASNVGVAPGQEARTLEPATYRTFTVAIGGAADRMTLSAIAARSGGVAYAASSAAAVPAILAELAARHSGNAPVLARTAFDLARVGEDSGGSKTSSSRDFEIPVESKARELVVFVGSRNDRVSDWRLLFELKAPDGERFDETAPQNHAERGFHVLRISDPRAGRWQLRVLPGGRGVQHSEILAYTEQENADFFVDADPHLATLRRSVHLSARPAYVTDIDGDISIQGVVGRPDGSEVPVVLTRNPITQSWGADFDQFAGRGFYEVRLHLRVGEGARPALGEPIFPGPLRTLARTVAFERDAMTSFYLADGPPPECTVPDCDGDGLSDKLENSCASGEDSDGDGMANRLDADSDNDEIFDSEEGNSDLDKDGVPDFCDAETTPDSLSGAIEAEEAASAAACVGEATASREGLKASLSAVRRILQVLRTRDGVPLDLRLELVQKLQKVVELKKQAAVIGDVLPEFCHKYQSRLEEALTIERELRVRVDPYLVGR